jgi:hypothetical protein
VAPQEDILEAIATVSGDFPRLGKLARAMPHDDRYFRGFGGIW